MDPIKDYRFFVLWKVHYKYGAIVHVLGFPMNFSIKLWIVVFGSPKKEELKLNTTELLSSMSLSSIFVPSKIIPWMVGNFPCFSSC